MKTSLWSAPFDRLAMTAALALSLAACDGSDGSSGKQGPPGPTGPAGPGGPGVTDTELSATDDVPGVNIEITGVSGGSGFADGGEVFLPGDFLSVTFTLTQDDGTPWQASEMDRLRAMIAGPTYNYQRVIPEVTDLPVMAVSNGGGSYTYTFADPIPATFQPYENDPDGPWDEGAGQWAGLPLLDDSGTYTVGVYGRWSYTVDGEGEIDVGDDTYDFRLGTAGPITPRAVTSNDNCNQCHARIEAHGGFRRNVTICTMCHLSGEVDESADAISVDFKVMIHKIHNGAHLPSVLGVTTFDSGPMEGLRDYDATPKPYNLDGFSIGMFSDILFPVWPSLDEPTLPDIGYQGLDGEDQDTEDMIRMGVIACDKCHGDPDGEGGPLLAPAEGAIAFQQPTRRACGSCHDDIVWEAKYISNYMPNGMPAQDTDGACAICHEEGGGEDFDGLAVRDAHIHPLLNRDLVPGLVVEVTAVDDAEPVVDDTDIDVGDKIAVTLNLKDKAGNEVLPGSLNNMNLVLSGPTSNPNILLRTSVPLAVLSAGNPHTFNVPEVRRLEYVGDSLKGLDSFMTTGAPTYDSMGATTLVQVAGPPAMAAGATQLDGDATAFQNWIDVDATTDFANGEYIVIDRGQAEEEYMRIQWVDVANSRLWFGSAASTTYKPSLLFDHADGADVDQVVLTTKVRNTDYELIEATGAINEMMDFGAGVAVLVSYTTDYVLPARYPVPENGSPDLGEEVGEWSTKSMVAGTYQMSIYVTREHDIPSADPVPVDYTYRDVSMDDLTLFRVISAGSLTPQTLISSPENCYACHNEIRFHGGNRGGVPTCLACHATAGDEDRPPYVNGGGVESPGVTINFREMLHKIHMGEELTAGAAYQVVGFGGTPHTYEHLVFPALPDGVKNCTTCHGSSNQAWMEPSDRNHPTEQMDPVLAWRVVCTSCHDSGSTLAHAQTQTSPAGVESCEVCHGEGMPQAVELVHRVR